MNLVHQRSSLLCNEEKQSEAGSVGVTVALQMLLTYLPTGEERVALELAGLYYYGV